MNDLRHFRPLFYFMVLLGISAYCWAAEMPGTWMIMTVAMLLNATLVFTGRFRPMPRFVSGALTVVAFCVSVILLWTWRATIFTVVADFLMLLLLVKLYEQRGDRDVAQALILNVLLVVSGAIMTSSLWFALVMAAYLVLALFVSLALYQKTEFEATAAAMGRPATANNAPPPTPADKRQLRRSVNRVMGFMVAVAAAVGVALFLFFPRGLAVQMLGAPQVAQVADPVTGLDDQSQVEQMVRVSQDTEIVAHVTAIINGKPATGTQPLWLRGKTVDAYAGNSTTRRPWTWEAGYDSARSATHTVTLGSLPVNAWYKDDTLNAETSTLNSCTVALVPTGTNVLFTPGRPLVWTASSTISPIPRVSFYSVDWTARCNVPINWPLTYHVTFDPRVTLTLPESDSPDNRDAATRPTYHSLIDPKISALAHDPAVCGVDANGASLAELYEAGQPSLDPEIGPNVGTYLAQNFQSYLHNKKLFHYTLDMSDQDKTLKGRDPIVVFLTETRRGYCEFFASAMTLMCQSVGLRARMVFGYRCDEFSPVGGFYVVRESDAHAWTEVLLGDEHGPQVWTRFDPTIGDEIAPPDTSLSARVMQFLDFLNYQWATAVITYDQTARQELVSGAIARLHSAADEVRSLFDFLVRSENAWTWLISPTLLAGVILMMSLLIVAAIVGYIVETVRLRRRARRVGIDGLERSDQHRLVRQLAFYDQMIVLLARNGIVRQPQMTPLEFSRSLWFLPPAVYQDIHRLTLVYYRIRYGQAEVDDARRRRLSASIDHIETILDREKYRRPEGTGIST